jgi:hypothetical protein
VARFGANVVMDILRTHPMVIIGGILQENPFFVPPDEFLRELRERAEQNSPLTRPSPPSDGGEGKGEGGVG